MHCAYREKTKFILYFPEASDGQQLPGNLGFKHQWLLQKASVDNGFISPYFLLSLAFVSESCRMVWSIPLANLDQLGEVVSSPRIFPPPRPLTDRECSAAAKALVSYLRFSGYRCKAQHCVGCSGKMNSI